MDAPFSANESNLFCGGLNDYDSAHASIADWVDMFDQSRLYGGVKSTSARAEVEGIEFELSEEQAQFKLPAMDDFSVIDPLNDGFINEHSMIVGHGAVVKNSEAFFDVKARLAGLEVKNFSLTAELEKNNGMPGRRTQKVEKHYFAP